MARAYGFTHVPSPAGGCLLTDPGYANRLRALKDNDLLSGDNARLIRFGRMFMLDEAIGLVGRSEAENNKMLETDMGIQLDIQDVNGPLGVLVGKKTEKNLMLLTAIMASYTKAEGPVTALSNQGESFNADRIDAVEREKYSIKL